MVLLAFTSGERALVTTLASTPAPRPRPVGPLPPGGLLLIWAWTEVATSVASAVAERTRRVRFIICASLVSSEGLCPSDSPTRSLATLVRRCHRYPQKALAGDWDRADYKRFAMTLRGHPEIQ